LTKQRLSASDACVNELLRVSSCLSTTDPPTGIGGSLLLVSEDSGMAGVAADCLLALVYTTPWDNYLIWRDVWHYGTDRGGHN